jgi:hypothetical protein
VAAAVLGSVALLLFLRALLECAGPMASVRCLERLHELRPAGENR